MLDTIERTETTTELPLDTTAKRALIETELRKDAGRSDREIARVIGCDHKTVGAARERLGIALPLACNISPPISPHACPPPPVDKPKYDPFDPQEGDMCQSAFKFDPGSASNF
jgi:hypothetical protein